MGVFASRALQAVNRVFRLVEGDDHVTSRLDTSAPLQLVHDVGPDAAYGAGITNQSGWHILQTRMTPAGAATTYAQTDPWAEALNWTERSLLPLEENIEVWWYDTFVFYQAASEGLTEFQETLYYPTTFPGVDNAGVTAQAMWVSIAGQELVDNPAAGGDGKIIVPLKAGMMQLAPRPLRMPFGSEIQDRAVTTVAATIDISRLMWAGPRGVLPPGMR